MSKIIIESHNAAPDQNSTWSGEVALPAGSTPEEKCERVFRDFNRVTEEDCERLDRIGYDLPSLSVNDTITFVDGSTYRVLPIGFERVR